MKENNLVFDCTYLPCESSELSLLMVFEESIEVHKLEGGTVIQVNAFCIFKAISRYFVYGWCFETRVWCGLQNFGDYGKARGYVLGLSRGMDPHPEDWS